MTGLNRCFSFAPGFSKLFHTQGSPSSGSFFLIIILNLCVLRVVVKIYLFVLDDSLTG